MEAAGIHVIFLGIISGLTSGAGVLPFDLVYKAVGETVKFNTTLTSAGNPITWRFNGTGIIISNAGENNILPGYEDRITIFPSTGSLELRNLAQKDSGEYSVSIFQGVTEEQGSTTLNVVERISGASVTPSTNQAIEGNSVNLTCDAAGSVFNKKWMKDGSDLTLADNMKFYEEKRVLSFQPLQKTDRGEYSCEISNPVSSMEAKHNLVVNFKTDEGLSAGAIARIVIACLVVVSSFVIGGYFIYKKKFNNRRQPMKTVQPQQPQQPQKEEHLCENSSTVYENL